MPDAELILQEAVEEETSEVIYLFIPNLKGGKSESTRSLEELPVSRYTAWVMSEYRDCHLERQSAKQCLESWRVG